MSWKKWLLIITVGSVSALLSFQGRCARASAMDASISMERQSEHVIQSAGQRMEFVLTRYQNENQETEIAVEYVETRWLLPDSKVRVLYGRDLDNDGFVDVWFPMGDAGVSEPIELVAKTFDGWDAASEVLSRYMLIRKRPAVSTALEAALARFTFAGESAREFFQQFIRKQLNLLDLEVRTRRMDRKAGEDPRLSLQLEQQREMLERGWDELNRQATSEKAKKIFQGALVDVVMAGAGYGVAKGVELGVGAVAPKIAQTQVGEYAGRIYDRFTGGFQKAYRNVMERLRGVGPIGTQSAAREWPDMAVDQQVVMTIKALQTRNLIAGAALKGLGKSLDILRAGLEQWRYIALSQTIQLVAEVYNRRDTIFDPNPIILAKNILNDKDLLQNLLYMTDETVLLTSVSSYSNNIPKRMAIAAMISLTDSSMVNLMFKGETDPKRFGLDTGWEMIVGNAQTQVDLLALNYLERKAKETGSVKLKLLGYAVVVVNQGLGYLGYSKITRAYEEGAAKEKADIRLVPVLQ